MWKNFLFGLMTTKYPKGKERNELFKNHKSVGMGGLLAEETACYALKDIVRERKAFSWIFKHVW